MSIEGAIAERETSSLSTDTLPTGFSSLLKELLADQQQLQTPVVAASNAYDAIQNRPSAISHRRFSELIPLSAPAENEQYAFEVDLDRCSGCKACVTGCHSLNGLDEEETWRDVGLLTGGCSEHPFQQTVTTACHHCSDPGCLNGCPVLAYEKDPVTGIVRHLDDQCIGCQYCVLKCPYDVPKYSDRLGIVRKCDMCQQRLSAGEAPACVQACPTEAIRIVKVDMTKAEKTTEFLPSSPSPRWTKPTTRYVTNRKLPDNLTAADEGALVVQHAHWPLALLLALTQISVGSAIAATISPGEAGLPMLGVSFLTAAVGLGASFFHLGQPLRAWRVFLNLRRSWLSREAVVFGGYFGALLGASVLAAIPPDPIGEFDWLQQLSAGIASFLGVVGVICSAMIYADTPRAFWRWPHSFGRMIGTMTVGALALLEPHAAAAALGAKLLLELFSASSNNASARIQRGPLLAFASIRLVLGAAAVSLFLLAPGWTAFATWAVGEILERSIFFKAVDPSKMPGVFKA